MSLQLQYCRNCLEAIQVEEVLCVHCGKRPDQPSMMGKGAAMLLLGLMLPGCPKPSSTADAELPSSEKQEDQADDPIALPEEQKEEIVKEVRILPGREVQALYGGPPVQIQKIRFAVIPELRSDTEDSAVKNGLMQLLAEKQSAVEECYSQGWRPGVSYPEELAVSVVVNDGQGVEVVLDAEQDSRLGECLRKELSTWSFPASSPEEIRIVLRREM